MCNNGFSNRAKSGQKVLPARLKRNKGQADARRAKCGRKK